MTTYKIRGALIYGKSLFDLILLHSRSCLRRKNFHLLTRYGISGNIFFFEIPANLPSDLHSTESPQTACCQPYDRAWLGSMRHRNSGPTTCIRSRKPLVRQSSNHSGDGHATRSNHHPRISQPSSRRPAPSSTKQNVLQAEGRLVRNLPRHLHIMLEHGVVVASLEDECKTLWRSAPIQLYEARRGILSRYTDIARTFSPFVRHNSSITQFAGKLHRPNWSFAKPSTQTLAENSRTHQQ